MKSNPKKFSINRAQALEAKPVAISPVRTEEKAEKLYVTVELERPKWQRILGGEATCERTFGLDTYGREVYDSCDGKTPVTELINTFSREHHMNKAEAELNVTTFLKTLISKGLVGVPLEQHATRPQEEPA